MSSPNINEERAAGDPIESITVSWTQDQPDAGKSAVIVVQRHKTGVADGEQVCSAEVGADIMEATTSNSGRLELSVPTCPDNVQALARGRCAGEIGGATCS